MSSIQSVDQLQRHMSGAVLLPGQAAYQSAVTIDNGRVQLHPALIVQANSVEDVAITLRFAREHKLRLTVKGGGHSASGYCLNSGGVVLDMSRMVDIQLKPNSGVVRVQMGARWHDVYVYLINSGTGLIPIGGGCPTVGIAGFMQGGGYSFVSRSYGMSIDNLLSITIVMPDGSVRKVGPSSKAPADKDLFWAVRGGGGGNWGVVVEMEIQAQKPNSEKMLTAQIRYDPAQAQKVLGFYNHWVDTLPKEMGVYGIWGMSPAPANPQQSILTFGFTAIYNGEPSEGAKLLQPLLELDPLQANLAAMTLPEFELLNGASTLVNQRSAYICSGMMAPKAFTPAAIAVFEKYMANAPSPDSFVVWTHGGGQIKAVKNDATAFAHRSAQFIPEVKSIWDKPQDARVNIEWAYHFFKELEPHLQGAYVNYIDPLLPSWAQKYYGDNYERLQKIKSRVDPQNLFGFQQGVGSTFEPSTVEPLNLAPLNRTFVD